MNTKKKKILYLAIACILIVIGLFIDKDGNSEVTNTEIEAADSDKAKLDNASDSVTDSETVADDYVAYYFRNDDLLEQHYEKHGVEMGFESMEAYEEAACAVIYHPDVLTKTEEEDGDYVYYVEESNEFVILSPDGYIRTYFNPSAGIDYFNRQ